jgi:hypothetical protein
MSADWPHFPKKNRLQADITFLTLNKLRKRRFLTTSLPIHSRELTARHLKGRFK